MSEFGVDVDGDYEKQRDGATALVRRVNDILLAHPETQNLNIRDLQQLSGSSIQKSRKDEVLHMSADKDLGVLLEHYMRHYPDKKTISINEGMHSVLPLRDSVSGIGVIFFATTLLLPEGRWFQTVNVTIRDEYIQTNSRISLDDSGVFDARQSVKARDDRLMTEAVLLLGAENRDLFIPLFNAEIEDDEVPSYLDSLRPIVAEQYDENETRRFLQEVETRYHEKRRSDETAQGLNIFGMTSEDMQELLAKLEFASD